MTAQLCFLFFCFTPIRVAAMGYYGGARLRLVHHKLYAECKPHLHRWTQISVSAIP